MDCYYHGHSGSPGGKCSECEREKPTITELERHHLDEARRERQAKIERGESLIEPRSS